MRYNNIKSCGHYTRVIVMGGGGKRDDGVSNRVRFVDRSRVREQSDGDLLRKHINIRYRGRGSRRIRVCRKESITQWTASTVR